MLPSTFCHLRGIGPATERRLWAAGLTAWDRLEGFAGGRHARRRAQALQQGVAQSAAELARGNPRFFAAALAPHEHWRLFPHFRHATAYLDIETTGIGVSDLVTCIGLYDGTTVRHYVQGQNLDDFVRDIRAYQVLVTYNGKCFDVPVLEHTFDIRLNQVHLDLRYILRSLGYRGGLKGCEKQLGFSRGELEGVDGYFAVLLWQDYVGGGNRKALDTLLAYNTEDVINLEPLMVMAYNRKLRETPFAGSYSLPPPRPVPNPFRADPGTLRRIRERLGIAMAGPQAE
jgi:uncharacterized protein YprB with RNaseH-like and TPR domain